MSTRSNAVIAAVVAVAFAPGRAAAWIEAPMSLGSVVQQSVVICSVTVTKVDREKNLIIYQKVADIKGKHPQDVIKHNIGRGGLRPGEWQEIMAWAEVGKTAVFFHNGGASETFFGSSWYQAYPQGEWWGMSHGEPFLLRSYSGKVDKLPGVLADMAAGKDVIVPCMVDGDKEALHKKTARVQRCKASMKLLDYNPKRDFVGWGGEDIRRLAGMPGFDRYAGLAKLDAEAQAVTVVDFDGDGKPDLCLCGANKVVLVQNGGDAFIEVGLPGLAGGARSAVWADYTGDGLPDLLLATPTGPKLYTNLGKGQFRDDTRLLPKEAAYNLTAAAWGDFDGDGKPDVLLANGFHGLRLYRNERPADAVKKTAPPKLGEWHAVGPFRATAGTNFDAKFGPEAEPVVDMGKTYKGKRDQPVKWTKEPFADGTVNDLARYGNNCAVYLTREIEVPAAADMPVSLGSDDTLTVWLNGEKVHGENVSRACAPDQALLTLNLKAGKNRLLLKVCQSDGAFAFYFAPGQPGFGGDPWFKDASAAWGLGADGPALKGDTLAVADFTGDGKPDFLYGAGSGQLFVNAGGRFALKADGGITYTPGKVGPALCDYDGDGHVDVFVPQADGMCKLFRNDGTGRFTDATASAGDLGKPAGHAVSAAWGDFDNDGKPDLVVCCLKGPNRFLRNRGDGTFEDKTEAVGLTQKVFNTQAAAFADLNGDGQLDLVLANEGQESAALFGALNPAAGARTAVVVGLRGACVGKVVVKDAGGKVAAAAGVFGGDGRGGQHAHGPRFALAPGAYTVEVVGTDGKVTATDVSVTTTPMTVRVN